MQRSYINVSKRKKTHRSRNWQMNILAIILCSLLIKYGFIEQKEFEMCKSHPLWIVFLRIQKTSTTAMGNCFSFRNGCNCGFDECQCQHNSASDVHGAPCSKMNCISKCKKNNCNYFLNNTPHADMVEFQVGFAKEGILARNVGYITMIRDPIQRYESEFRWILEGVPNNCSENHITSRRMAWDYNYPCQLTMQKFSTDARMIQVNSNRQTKMIAGLGEFSVAELYGSQDKMLRVAKMNLELMYWYGSQNVFISSFRKLKKTLYCYQRDIVMKNELEIDSPSTRKIESRIPLHLRKMIHEANSLDVKLYEYGMHRLRRSWDKTYARKGSQRAEAIREDVLVVVDNSSVSNEYTALIGEIFDEDVTTKFPDCKFAQTEQEHIGTWTWYDEKFGCAFPEPWLDLYTLRIPRLGVRVKTRIFWNEERKSISEFILLIGAAQTMGIQSSKPYGFYISKLTSYPVILVGWGGVGADFYSTFLEEDMKISKILRYLIKRAKYVIVQAMSARSSAKSACEQKCWNMYCKDGRAVQDIIQNQGRNERKRIVQEWHSSHSNLLKSVKRKMSKSSNLIFHYISTSTIGNWDENNFPHFVDSRNFSAQLQFLKKEVKDIVGVVSELEKISVDVLPLKKDQCYFNHGNDSKLACVSRGSGICTMHNLKDNCECGHFRIEYYPGSKLHRLAGLQISHVIRGMDIHSNMWGLSEK